MVLGLYSRPDVTNSAPVANSVLHGPHSEQTVTQTERTLRQSHDRGTKPMSVHYGVQTVSTSLNQRPVQ